MKNISQRLAEFIIGWGLASFLWICWLQYNEWQKISYPIEDIFVATVAVPDFLVGSNPGVVYDRTIKRSFVGGFTVEVKNLKQITVCWGSANGIKYDKGEQTDPTRTTLSWYVGNKCAEELKVGQYYLETTYTIDVEGFPRKYLTTTSNIFTVGEPEK